jgi:phage baseplate assembly protein V
MLCSIERRVSYIDYDTDTIFGRDSTGRDGQVRNMYRQGKVVEQVVDETQVSVKVQWLDKDGLISKPLPVKQKGSRSTSEFYCPKIGDDVCVTMLPNSTGVDGFVDGSFYNVGNPPPTIDPNVRHIKYVDGTVMEYAEKGPVTSRAGKTSGTGTLTIISVGPANLKFTACYLEAGAITLKGPVTIEGDVTINGNLQVNGNISNTGDMTTDGIHTDSIGRHDA